MHPHIEPGTTSRSPFATEVVIEDLDIAAVAATLARIEEKETLIMAVQDDINAAAAAISDVLATVATAATDLTNVAATVKAQADANGADTTELNAAVAGIPAVTEQLAVAQAAVDALAPASAPVEDASAGAEAAAS